MKKIFTILSIGVSACAYGQLNPGMENWSLIPFSANEDPVGYVSANVLTSSFVNPANPQSAFKVTSPDINGGTYALKLVTVALVTNPDPVTIPDPYHFCFTGTYGVTGLKYGYPYTARPATMNFYAKYTPVGADSAYGLVVLQRWNGATRDTVAVGFVGWVGASASYSLKSMTLNYLPAFATTGFPDTCVIAYSSSANLTPQVGSALFVDDMSFLGWNGISEINSGFSSTAFPNPATDNIMISVNSTEPAEAIAYDGMGRVVGNFKMNAGLAKINTSAFRAGEYHYSLLDKNKKVLSGGTFTVVK